jgi:tetratricopeptide (TPR) repeat protein
MKAAVRTNVAQLTLVAVLLAAAIGIAAERDRRYPRPAIDDRLLYVRSARAVEKMALSYDAVLADVYWVRALQHFGTDRLAGAGVKRFDLLYPLLDLTTSLDPDFTVAYRFGAIFLAEPYPGGAGRPDLAVQLLEKGIRQKPDKWEYYYDIGMLHYWRLHQYQQAADWFVKGHARPGAPWWLRTHAAMILAKGGSRDLSRVMWQQILSTADNEWVRENAQLRLVQLDALDQIDYLNSRVGEYTRRNGRFPESWNAVVAERLLPGYPTDPTGSPYVLDPLKGRVTVSDQSKLYPLPVEPGASTAPSQP